MFFPLILILLVVLKLGWEYWQMGISICGDVNINWAFAFDFTIGAIIVGYTIAYIRNGQHLSGKRFRELIGQ